MIRLLLSQRCAQAVKSFSADNTDPPKIIKFHIEGGAAECGQPASDTALPRRSAHDPSVPAHPVFAGILLKLMLIRGHDADVDGAEPHEAQLLSLLAFI